MLKTSLVYSIERSFSQSTLPAGQSGFRTVITVTEATNIDPNIFVYHRKFLTSAGEDVEDRFETVSSVADLENLPSAPEETEGFYRKNVADLIYRHTDDENKYTAKIISMMNKLIRANDLVINLQPPQIFGIPELAMARYWGQSTLTSLSDVEIQGLANEAASSRPTSKTITTEGPRYLYLIYREELGEGTFTLNGVGVDMTLETRVFVNADGHAHNYRIYRTTALQGGGTLVLAVT